MFAISLSPRSALFLSPPTPGIIVMNGMAYNDGWPPTVAASFLENVNDVTSVVLFVVVDVVVVVVVDNLAVVDVVDHDDIVVDNVVDVDVVDNVVVDADVVVDNVVVFVDNVVVDVL